MMWSITGWPILGAQVAELVSVGSQPEERFGLLGRQTVGREPSCEIVLLRASVSRRHAVLSTENGRTTVEDLGSKNGTFVNNEAVEVRMLVNGDRIRFGDQVFELVGDMVGPTFKMHRYGNLRIDENTRQVWREDQELATRLTPQEFNLLAYVAKRRGEVCSRSEIGDHIWGAGAYDNMMLYQLVRRLRTKIEVVPGDPQYVTTVPRIGYKFE